jgi:hypothetical protein
LLHPVGLLSSYFAHDARSLEEEIVDAPGNGGNASMPEQVKRPNPWRKMMMMTMKTKQYGFVICFQQKLNLETTV